MAGTVAVASTSFPGTNRVRYDIDWTATAGGAVSGNALPVKAGRIIQAEFVPGTGSPGTPSAAYDLTLVDQYGADMLAGAGANLSETAAKLSVISAPPLHDGVVPLELVVANAGSAGSGRLVLWLEG